MKILLLVALGSQEDVFIAPSSLTLETDPPMAFNPKNCGVLMTFHGKLRPLFPQVI